MRQVAGPWVLLLPMAWPRSHLAALACNIGLQSLSHLMAFHDVLIICYASKPVSNQFISMGMVFSNYAWEPVSNKWLFQKKYVMDCNSSKEAFNQLWFNQAVFNQLLFIEKHSCLWMMRKHTCAQRQNSESMHAGTIPKWYRADAFTMFVLKTAVVHMHDHVNVLSFSAVSSRVLFWSL